MAIHDKSEGNNIILLTVKNRQPKVLLQQLLKHDFVKQKLFHEVDMKEHNALHLAAELGKQKPWIILGAALQMHGKSRWYELKTSFDLEFYNFYLTHQDLTTTYICSKAHNVIIAHHSKCHHILQVIERILLINLCAVCKKLCAATLLLSTQSRGQDQIISFIVQQLPLYLDYAQDSSSEVPPSSYKAIFECLYFLYRLGLMVCFR